MHPPLGDPWVIYVYCGTIVTLGEGIPVCTDHWVTHGYTMYVYCGTIVTLGEPEHHTDQAHEARASY